MLRMFRLALPFVIGTAAAVRVEELVADLLLTMLQAVDVPAQHFADSIGPIEGLFA